MKKQPYFTLVVALILGIFFQDHFDIKFTYLLFFLIMCFAGLFLVFLKKLTFLRFKDYFSFVFMLILGAFLLNISKSDPPKIALNKTENLIFSLSKKLNSTQKNRRYEVEFYRNDIVFKSVLTIPRNQEELNFSHYYKAEVSIKKTEKPYADFIFNYQKYLARKNIFYQAYLPGKLYRSNAKSLSLSENIKNARLKILNKISASSLTGKSGSFLKGIILADRTEMDSETISDFQKSGLIHILAISGTHIGIIFGIFYFLLINIFPGKLRSYAIVLSLILIWSFGIFIGLGNSVTRACIMISIYFTYVLLQRKPDLLHALSLAGLIILLINPQQIFDVGFQLSFSAVLGIYWLYKPILKLIPRYKFKFANFLVSILVITITAKISTLPLVLYYFHQFSLISIIANMFVIPLAEIIIAFSLFLTLILSLNINVIWLNKLYDILILNLLKLIHWFGSLDFTMNDNISLNTLEVVLLIISLYFLRFVIIKFNWRTVFRFAFILLIFTSFRMVINFQQNQKNEVVNHLYFGKKIVSIKNEKEIIFLVPKDSDSVKIEKYIINPYLIEVRNENYIIKRFDENTKTIVINQRRYSVQ